MLPSPLVIKMEIMKIEMSEDEYSLVLRSVQREYTMNKWNSLHEKVKQNFIIGVLGHARGKQ